MLSEWTITEFLEECDANLFTEKIGRYLTSLESIISNDDGSRSRKAQELYNRYKQAKFTNFFVAKNINKELVTWRGTPRFLSFKSLR